MVIFARSLPKAAPASPPTSTLVPDRLGAVGDVTKLIEMRNAVAAADQARSRSLTP